MANKIGNLIKKSRTDAGLTQEQLAKKVKNTSAADISKAERGELKLSQEALKQIAKATGVTQKSLLDAAAASSYKTSSGTTASTTKKSGTAASTTKKSSTASSAAKKSSTGTSAKKSTKSTSTSTKKSSSSSSGSSMKVSAAERKLVELYRAADSDTKKKVMELLKTGEISMGGVIGDALEGLLGGALDIFNKG